MKPAPKAPQIAAAGNHQQVPNYRLARIRIIARFHARQRPLSEDAALLRELGIAFLSKLEQLSQRARWPVAREKHKTSSFAMTISKQPLRRRPDRL